MSIMDVKFYIGLLTSSYLVAYTQNYNQHYKHQYISITYNFVIMLNLHLIYVLNLKMLHHNLKSSLYYERLKFTKGFII